MECACCPRTEVRLFCGVPLCERCADEGGYVCRECGSLDHITAEEGPTMCAECRAVEACESVDWCEGKEVTA